MVGGWCSVSTSISDEREHTVERTKQNAGHELEAKNKDLQWKLWEDFDISQEFFFGQVRKLCFLCSCKQTLVFVRHTRACTASYVIRRKDSLSFAERTQNFLYHFKYLQKCMDSLHEAFIHPQSRVRHVLLWMHFIWLPLDCWTETPAHAIIKLGRARTIFNITLIGFVWKKKVIYT